VIYDRPIRELLVDDVAAMRPTFRRSQVVEWFQEHYPLVKPSAVTAHITAATVNSPSRHHYNGAAQDLIFKRDDGSLERYDEPRHGRWDLYGNRISGNEPSSHPPYRPNETKPASPQKPRPVPSTIMPARPDARGQIGSALEVLAGALAPFVVQRMCAVRGPDWYESFRSPGYGTSEDSALRDPRFLLKIMIELWDEFCPPLSRMERSIIFELREWGNRWAHNASFSADDVDRTFDSVERLLIPIDTEAATAVRRVKFNLRRRG
jgi:hypothetical protein